MTMQAASKQNSSMTEEYLREKVLHVLGKIAPEANLEGLDPKQRYRDQCEFDSIDFLNLAMGLQEELKVTIPESDYPKLATLAGCVDYLRARMGSQLQG